VTAVHVGFFALAFVILASAVRMVTTTNVVHAALYLMLVLSGVAGVFILLGAEFLGWTQVLVYIGAIVVIFMFGVMLTKAEYGVSDDIDNEPAKRWGALVVGFLIAALFIAVFVEALGVGDSSTGIVAQEREGTSARSVDVSEIDLALTDENVVKNINVLASDSAPWKDEDAALMDLLHEEGLDFPRETLLPGPYEIFPVLETPEGLEFAVPNWDLEGDRPAQEKSFEMKPTGTPVPRSLGTETVSVPVCDYLSGRNITRRDNGEVVMGEPLFCPTKADEVANDLFNRWVLPFEAVSLVLLAALIGGIVLARRDDPEHVRPRVEEVAV